VKHRLSLRPTRHLTDQGVIAAIKIARDLNVADAGTHYCTKEVIMAFDKALRNMG